MIKRSEEFHYCPDLIKNLLKTTLNSVYASLLNILLYQKGTLQAFLADISKILFGSYFLIYYPKKNELNH
ncbi:MAG TPA: hypothetical protein DDX92_14085 [Flavobacteriales bacterium]|nr:hypothetical protein [Flavobacteriales bacterium]